MEALRAIIRGDLSPAGNKISLKKQPELFGYSIDGYIPTWVDSGTSALALALIDIKAKAMSRTTSPKVIIPGYCCPDLVAAAVYAGVKPVVVDICINDASYDLDALQTAVLDEDIVAVIAVNFLGIKERLGEIKRLLQNKPIKIIEDNAQWFPASKNEHQFMGDYLLFSFGRGKPLSLLGGGVLFAKELLAIGGSVLYEPSAGLLAKKIKVHLYNFLLNPHFYCYLNRAPFLHLGETHYHQHNKIKSLGNLQQEIFLSNYGLYSLREGKCEVAYDKLFIDGNLQSLISLEAGRRMRLLRYPLLCKTVEQRNWVLSEFGKQGLGVSPLYQKSIVEISQVSDLVEVHGQLKNARQFASRLLTLPIHEQVNSQHIAQMRRLLDTIN